MPRVVKQGLTERMIAFLHFREQEETDIAAAQRTDLSPTSIRAGIISKWRKNNPDFAKAYEESKAKWKRPEMEIREDVEVQKAIDAAKALEKNIAEIVTIHLNLVREAKSDSTRLDAIKLAYQVMGVFEPKEKDRLSDKVLRVYGPLIGIYQQYAPLDSVSTLPLPQPAIEAEYNEVKGADEEEGN